MSKLNDLFKSEIRFLPYGPNEFNGTNATNVIDFNNKKYYKSYNKPKPSTYNVSIKEILLIKGRKTTLNELLDIVRPEEILEQLDIKDIEKYLRKEKLRTINDQKEK